MLEGLTFLDSVKKMPGMALPVRSVAVNVAGGRVLLGPGSRLTDEQLRSLGPVTDVVAPSIFHDAGAPLAHRILPEARLWGPAGIEQSKPQLTWSSHLGETPWPYESGLRGIKLGGMPKVNEFVFFHPASRSLIVFDLCFNTLDSTGLGAWIAGKLFGTYRRFGVSRFFLMFVKDRAAFEASLKEVLACDFDNIIVSHGDNVIGGAKERLRAALAERGYTI